jgi:hypothetical protein
LIDILSKKKKIGEAAKALPTQPSIQIEVTDLTSDQKTVYSSITLAAKAIGVRKNSISTYLSKERAMPFKQKYLFKKIGEPDSEVLDKKSTITVIEVTDLTAGGNKTNYFSISAAAKAFNIPISRFKNHLIANRGKPSFFMSAGDKIKKFYIYI